MLGPVREILAPVVLLSELSQEVPLGTLGSGAQVGLGVGMSEGGVMSSSKGIEPERSGGIRRQFFAGDPGVETAHPDLLFSPGEVGARVPANLIKGAPIAQEMQDLLESS